MAWLRRALFAIGVLGGVWIAHPIAVTGTAADHTDDAPQEVRALWVTRTSLTSPAAIATVVTTAKAQGFNTLLVQVRGRADAYYTSTLEPRPGDLVRQPAAFDPLATVLAGARPHPLFVNAGRRDGSLRVALYRHQVEPLGLVLYALDGQPLPPAHGGPFRLVLPGFHDAARDLTDLGWLELATRPGVDNRAEFARERTLVIGQQSFPAARTWRDPREDDTVVIPPPNA